MGNMGNLYTEAQCEAKVIKSQYSLEKYYAIGQGSIILTLSQGP